MRSLLETPCFLVIFTDNYLYNVIYNIRDSYKLSHLTQYVIKEFTELDVYTPSHIYTLEDLKWDKSH